jgi:hypothetical protein
MEKDLERTLLKRYEEAKALEKKKKRSKRATMKAAALIGTLCIFFYPFSHFHVCFHLHKHIMSFLRKLAKWPAHSLLSKSSSRSTSLG